MATEMTADNGSALADESLRAGALLRRARQRAARLNMAQLRPQPAALGGWVSQRFMEKSGHSLTYLGLVLFTFVVYFKPQDFLHFETTPNIAFLLAVLTVLLYIPTQLRLEGRLSARPRELDLLLAFALLALLSMPVAVSRSDAWTEFNNMFLKAVLMFIVIINAVRTEQRLRGLLYIAIAVAFVSGASTLNNYRAGTQLLEGYRSTGILGGILLDPNDMSLYIVMTIPIVVALLWAARGWSLKLCYACCALIMAGGIMVTYSRGGFLGLLAIAGFLAWKLGRRQPVLLLVGGVMLVGLLVASPGGYAGRLASITNPDLDATGSASERRELLDLSLQVAARHPLFGVGMGNFPNVSIRDKPSHNAYTQVASEMGVMALAVYVSFIIVPLLRLRRIEKETYGVAGYERIYALAIGLQASLVGYLVSSFFLSVAYYWFIYYLVAYTVCLRRIYETGPGRVVGHVTPNNVLNEDLVEAESGSDAGYELRLVR